MNSLFQEVPLKQMQELSDNALVTLSATPGAMGHLHSLRDVDNYTFLHSVNVAIICGILSRWLGDDSERMKDMGWPDCSMTWQGDSAGGGAQQAGALSAAEMEVMKRHAEYGYDMLKKAKVLAAGVPHRSMAAPRASRRQRLSARLRDGNILPSARIIAISDIYDAMTSDRVYRRKMTPFAVIKTLFENMFDKLDAAMCTVFLNNLKDYFVGSTVELTDGRLAEVIYMDWLSWDRLTVRTYDGEYIELGEHAEEKIVRCLQA
jgi:HD-GYP domain-containing protein (c-di-GMP phosphodiesterase class II)